MTLSHQPQVMKLRYGAAAGPRKLTLLPMHPHKARSRSSTLKRALQARRDIHAQLTVAHSPAASQSSPIHWLSRLS